MNQKEIEQFLSTETTNNTDWCAKRIATDFTKEQFCQLYVCIQELDAVLYKSWAKDMSFREIKEAVDKVSELIK